jgi:hypothetical protein
MYAIYRAPASEYEEHLKLIQTQISVHVTSWLFQNKKLQVDLERSIQRKDIGDRALISTYMHIYTTRTFGGWDAIPFLSCTLLH